MDSWNFSYAASVHYSSNKACFLYVPDKWLKREVPLEVLVFKVTYRNNKTAFLSCQKLRCLDGNEECEVQINAKYAEKLGIKEKEKVFLQLYASFLPKAQKIVLEPVTEDDWEMLELNASLIESDLMNQIRIVWKDQVFPIWANQCSFFVKINKTFPDHVPVLLGEFTEIHIVPKVRAQNNAYNSRLDKVPKSVHSQFQFLRFPSGSKPEKELSPEKEDDDDYFDSENRSATLRALSLISSWFSTASEEKFLTREGTNDTEEFVPIDFDAVLRVVPYSNPSGRTLPLVVQATTVFISVDTYVLLYGAKDIPPCFVAVLEKVPLPGDRKLRKTHGNSQRIGKDQKEDISKDPSRTKNETDKVHELFDSVVVSVMVVRSPEEDEFNLPLPLFYSKNLIVVPKELKRCLNLEVASLVHLKSVQFKPIYLNMISLHPVSALPPSVTEEVMSERFSSWAYSNNLEQSTFTISSGTLASLHIHGKTYDFFISIQKAMSTSPNTLHNHSELKKASKLKTVPEYSFLTRQVLKRMVVKIGDLMDPSIFVDRPCLQKTRGLYQEILALRLEALGGVSELAAKIMENIDFWLKLRPIAYISNHSFTFCGCILVCGPKGVGKSALTNAICKKLMKYPYHVFVQTIHCLPLKGKRVDSIAKKWDDIVSQAIHSQPSVILFEDLDYIASCPTSHEQEVGPDGVYFSSVVQAFIHLMNRVIASESRVTVIVTAQSTHSLHPSLMNTKGRHIFQSVFEIHPPDIEQRIQILKSLICSKPHISRSSINLLPWTNIAAKTEGYVAQDLDSLVDRATHSAWVRLVSSSNLEEIPLILEDFEMALEGYVPSSLRGIPLQIRDQKTWKDVGGLGEVKKVVQQIIMWPVKYKHIFKNYSLKPQTNILLYGAPGTGKTMLAGVVANECGLNFISIKGPELLSKYIGASEQAVRDLFKRASAARPCILFFDEFDSIAPRRGHDSTGVTDRVVNQLLTQLDGVESLEGVHVLAATSRPELIDPALLRPGRLDKCLLCPLPNEEERVEILRCLSSKLPLCEEIDFQAIASCTEYFSGADLQALLYTAHIKALHDSLKTSSRRYSTCSDDLSYSDESDKLLYMASLENGLTKPSYEDGKKIIQEVNVIKEKFGVMSEQRSSRSNTLSVAITQRHLEQVAEEMKPSVSPQERLRYKVVFQKFQTNLGGGAGSSITENMKRVTLA
ncbi:peroxisomal ATPase PEX1-like [Uloborus diversus]|uniref:peroxisomal ATPase PEX1-like n=1 Tax=Uloborus diversus TaxID=327109 RepID=UPI002409DE86|nr:peroxisomal ATPase PEX1-like [Uloborus diversus]